MPPLNVSIVDFKVVFLFCKCKKYIYLKKMIIEVDLLIQKYMFNDCMMLIFELVLHLKFEFLTNKLFSVVSNAALNALILTNPLVLPYQ